ncbi:Nitrogenase (iron-iron) delta chain (EC [Kosakonia radicincitans]|nr:Fe-only/vanadium nitrogenase subunit delta [Kosakonia radicincitans]VVT51463.1 Nitrogenase (iron-iron) delta chain (EC [Kosakonia radicincitans]
MTQDEQVELMVDYIMKHCLWQFHSRTWDREKQNAGVLGKTRQLLCGEEVELANPADRCYWADAWCWPMRTEPALAGYKA